MAKGSSKKDDIIKQIESLHTHIKVRFATRLIDLAIQHDFYHFLDLSHTDWYQYAKIALSQVEDQNPPLGNLTPYASGSYDNQSGISLLGLRESIRYAMKDLFAEALVFAEEPWAESHSPATERWSWFYMHQDNTTTVFSESPQVLPYWYWFARANPHLADVEPVAAISQDIAERISKSAWRFLVNQLPWSLAMQFCPGPKPEQRYEQLIALLVLIQTMNLPQKFDLYRLAELASAAKQLDVHPITASSMQDVLSISWMRSLLVAPTISGDVMQQLMIVLQWYRNNKRLLTTNTDRSWKNIYEEAKEWARYQDQLMQREALYWYSHIDRFRVGDYEIVPLTSSEDLLEEGFYMSHCVGDLAYSCIDETLRVFSLRDSRTGKRIATISIINDWCDASEDEDSMLEDMEQSFGDGWRVDQVYGYANSAAPKAIHDLASFIAFSYPF